MARPADTVGSKESHGTILATLCQPAPVVAMLVLVGNDHVLKGRGVLPGFVTGKLSDIAGLFLFPILLAAIVRLCWQRAQGRRVQSGALFCHWIPALAAGATLVGFTALKTWPAFNQLVESFWGMNSLDAGDLLALPMVGLAWWWLRAYDNRTVFVHRPGRVAQVVAVTVAALACAATSPARMSRNYPMWRVDSAQASQGCARITPAVSKSGKSGVGLTLAVRGLGPEICRVQIDLAALNLVAGSAADGQAVRAVRARPAENSADRSVDVSEGQVAYLYLPFLFDNNRAWNEGLRGGYFQIRLAIGGQELPEWRIPAEHRLDGYHRDRQAPYRRSSAPGSIAR